MSIDALIDTGASCSIIKDSIAKRLNCNIEPYSNILEGIGNGKLHIFGRITVPVQFDDTCIEIEFNVARNTDFRYDCLIGRNITQYPDISILMNSEGCKVIQIESSMTAGEVNQVESGVNDQGNQLNESISHLETNLQSKIKALFEKYPAVLPSEDNIGTVKTGEMHLRLKRDEIIHYRPYRLAPIEREKINEICKDLVKKNIIRESDSPYASPVLLVKKKRWV